MLPDRRQFLWAALPLAVCDLARTASPPPVKVAEELKPIKGDEVLPLPAGAMKRLGTPNMRVHGYLNAIQFSPKGTTLVAASGSELRGWDPRTGKVKFRFGYPSNGSVDSGRLTSRDTFALLVRPSTGGKYEIQHYAFGTGKLIGKPATLDVNQTQHTTFSIDGTQVVIVRQEGLCLVDAETGKEKWREALPAEAVGGCRFFADGATIAVAAKGEVKLFAAATGKLTSSLKVSDKEPKADGAAPGNRGKDWLQDMVISSDGRWLATSVGEDGDLICVWDVKSAKIVHRFKPATKPIDFTPDNKELLTYKDGVAKFWNLTDGKSRQLDVPNDRDLTLSPDGKILASGVGDAAILIDSNTGKHLAYSADPPGSPEALVFRGSHLFGKLSAWGGWVEWNIASGTPRLIRPDDVSGLSPVALSNDGERVLYRREGNYHLREIRSGRELAKVTAGTGNENSRSGNESASLTPDGRTVVAWKSEGLTLTSVGEAKAHEITRTGVSESATVVAVSGDNLFAAVGLNRNGRESAVDLFDLRERKFLRRLVTQGDAGAIAFTPDSELVAIAHDANDVQFGRRMTVAVFDVDSGKPIFRMPPDENTEHIIALSADGRLLARVEPDDEKKPNRMEPNDEKKPNRIAFWEVLSGSIRTRLEHAGSVRALAFAPDGRTLAASVQGAPVFLRDLHGGTRPPAPGRANLEQAWGDLLKPDSAAAFAAIKLLAAHPECSIPYLREVIQPIAPPEEAKVNQLIADLDHKDFRKRESATKELAALGERARGALRQAVTQPLSPETRERVERLLSLEDRPSPEYLRQVRAIEAIEVASGSDALKLLEHWGGGAAGATFTRNAQSAAKRVKARMN